MDIEKDAINQYGDIPSKEGVIFFARESVKVGQLHRFRVSFEATSDPLFTKSPDRSLWIRIRNLEPLPMRAAYLMGPYILYCDVKSSDYDHNQPTFITDDQPTFEPELKASQSFFAKLSCHTFKRTYEWTIDVISQIIFSSSTSIAFDITIGYSKNAVSSYTSSNHPSAIGSFLPCLQVTQKNTADIWNQPPIRTSSSKDKSIHLVLMTHGLHSNVGADMLYIRDQLEASARRTGHCLMIRGFHGNACKTERGVRYLGKRVALYLLTLYANTPEIKKISFIGHSLGGLVQTYVLAYIESHSPSFFQKVEPVNFITLASPFLGIFSDNPAYVKMALDFGFVGKTGQDLGLYWRPSEKNKGEGPDGSNSRNGLPLIRVLPTGPTHRVLKRFKRRTCYANAVNDGIVPLRTGSILFIDWKGLAEAAKIRRNQKSEPTTTAANESSGPSSSSTSDIKAMSYGDLLNKMQEDFKQSLQPLQAAFSFLMPQNQKDQPMEGSSGDDELRLKYLPKIGIIKSAASVILPPLPDPKFITDPASRPTAIFHDKLYTPEEIKELSEKYLKLVDSESSGSNILSSFAYPSNEIKKFEVETALAWHNELEWRKVLVELQPDAHNNISVRRMFSNAYGWEVIDHLVQNHFDSDIDESTIVLQLPDDDCDDKVMMAAEKTLFGVNDEDEDDDDESSRDAGEEMTDESGYGASKSAIQFNSYPSIARGQQYMATERLTIPDMDADDNPLSVPFMTKPAANETTPPPLSTESKRDISPPQGSSHSRELSPERTDKQLTRWISSSSEQETEAAGLLNTMGTFIDKVRDWSFPAPNKSENTTSLKDKKGSSFSSQSSGGDFDDRQTDMENMNSFLWNLIPKMSSGKREEPESMFIEDNSE